MTDEYEEEEAPQPKQPKRPRKPIDWALWIMLIGTLVFILVFGAITLMAPRRPFLVLRGLGPGGTPAAKPVATAAAATPTGAATPVATAPPKA
jgi:hypothetical protein